jgi:hypothetical protein
MATGQQPDPDFVPVAELEVDSVEPARSGFVLRGFGADSAEYRLDLHLDMPVDPKTQAVLGGILSQSEWRIWRRAPRQLRTRPAGRTSSPAR